MYRDAASVAVCVCLEEIYDVAYGECEVDSQHEKKKKKSCEKIAAQAVL